MNQEELLKKLMATYKVHVSSVMYVGADLDIEAGSKEQARRKALALWKAGAIEWEVTDKYEEDEPDVEVS